MGFKCVPAYLWLPIAGRAQVYPGDAQERPNPAPPPTKGKRTALDQKVHSQAFKTSQQIGWSGLLLNAAGLIGSRGGAGAEDLNLV
jgi:hypothetical protein